MKHLRLLCAFLLLLLTLTLSLAACVAPAPADLGYSFTVNGHHLTPGSLVGDSLQDLGTYEFSESGSCGGIPGSDEVYRYVGFTVYTTPGREGQIIARIELTDDTYTTEQGVRVGDSRATVTELTGIGENVGSNLVYTGEGTRLTFVIRDDVVVGISYTEK